MEIVKSFQVDTYWNMKKHEETYGVIVRYGTGRDDTKRMPVLFKDKGDAHDMALALKNIDAIGKPVADLISNPKFKEVIVQFGAKAYNTKKRKRIPRKETIKA
jgi:hypothetical protein